MEKEKRRNANTSHDDYLFYVRSIELLTKMRESGNITEEEYSYLKKCFMEDCQVVSDFSVGRSPDSPMAGTRL